VGNLGLQSGVCDVRLQGSGAGGFAAALTASLHGLDVIMVEKESLFGGTTAYFRGVIWIPVNFHQKAAGVTDTREDALTYLTHHVGNRLDCAKAEAFQRSGDARPVRTRRYCRLHAGAHQGRLPSRRTRWLTRRPSLGRTNTMAGRLVRVHQAAPSDQDHDRIRRHDGWH